MQMQQSLLRKWLTLMGALAALGVAQAAQAEVQLTPTITFDGTLYNYQYTVVNNTPNDLSIVTFAVIPGMDTVQNLMAPDGFLANFDSVNGLVDFLEGDPGMGGMAFTAGMSFSGFAFDSPFAPNPSMFTAFDVELNQFNGITFAPNVPEPGSVALLGASATTGFFWLRRRKRQAR